MNYFSHYLLIPDQKKEYLSLGCILPDLLRDKKIDTSFFLSNDVNGKNVHHVSLFQGIKNHIESDALFHNSAFFKTYTKQIAKAIRESNEISLSKYTYFVAHILLELYIDHIFITQHPLLLQQFYQQIERANNQHIKSFFSKYLPNNDVELFLLKKDKFVTNRFLNQYSNLQKIGSFLSYVLQKVTIDALAEQEQKAIIELIEDKFGAKIVQDLPILMTTLKEQL